MAVSQSPPPVDLPIPRSEDQRKRVQQPSNSESEEPKKKPIKMSPPRQSKCKKQKNQPSQSSNVYLLDGRAVGSSAASNPETQQKFLEVMGITEKMELPEMDCPLPKDLPKIIAVANLHQYIGVLENYPESDGLCIHEHLEEMMRRWKDGVYSLCGCIAHAELALEKPDAYKRHLRQLIRMQTPLHNDTGILFSVALLELLMGALGKSNFVAQRSGLVDSVSYVLMADDSEHMFRGYPNFAIHYESSTMANRILVLMGEVQSTRDPATQNAIYAVGNLAATPLKQLLVLTIMKKKMATTAIAQLKPGPLSSPPDALAKIFPCNINDQILQEKEGQLRKKENRIREQDKLLQRKEIELQEEKRQVSLLRQQLGEQENITADIQRTNNSLQRWVEQLQQQLTQQSSPPPYMPQFYHPPLPMQAT